MTERNSERVVAATAGGVAWQESSDLPQTIASDSGPSRSAGANASSPASSPASELPRDPTSSSVTRRREPRAAALGKPILILVGLGMIALIAWAVMQWNASRSSNTESAAAADSLLLVSVAPLEPHHSYSRRIAYTGAVRAARSAVLGFELPGRVVSVLVDEGDHVLAEQTVAQLDRRKLEASRRELAAALAVAQAQLTEAVAGPRQQTISAAEQRAEELRADLALAEQNLERTSRLRNQSVASQQEFDQTTAARNSALARLEVALLTLDELREGTRKEQIDAARATVTRLEAQLAELDLRLEDCDLSAPFAGQIVRRWIDEGSIVSAGQRVVELVESDQLEVWMGIPVAEAHQLPINTRVSLEIAGRKYDARVTTQLAELDRETRTRTIIFSLEPEAGTVLPAVSELARLEMVTEEVVDGFWVPLSAMTRGPRGLWSLLVAEPTEQPEVQRVARINVEVLHAQTDRAYVRGPLAAGAQLIDQGAHRVIPGQRVRVSPVGSTSPASG